MVILNFVFQNYWLYIVNQVIKDYYVWKNNAIFLVSLLNSIDL